MRSSCELVRLIPFVSLWILSNIIRQPVGQAVELGQQLQNFALHIVDSQSVSLRPIPTMLSLLTLSRPMKELHRSNGFKEPMLQRHLSLRSRRCLVLLLIKDRRVLLMSSILLSLATCLLLVAWDHSQPFLRILSSLGSTTWLIPMTCLLPKALLLFSIARPSRAPKSSRASQQVAS